MSLARLSLLLILFALNATHITPGHAYDCPNGRLEDGEQCDDGERNSDIAPDACRSDCRLAYCGDGVVDTGEECDNGSQNSNRNANACRENCKLPRCGDGVADNAAPYNEECDDKNSDNTDGCMNSCKSCVKLGDVGNIETTANLELCSGEVKLDDYGDFGTVIVKRSGIMVNCNGLRLTGEGRGVGIMVYRSNNVTIKNCDITGYDYAIKGEYSNNITLLNNSFCGNKQVDIELPGTTQMNGTGNKCAKPGGWSDTGKTGCSQRLFACNLPKVNIPRPELSGTAKQNLLKTMPHITAQPKKALPNVKAPANIRRMQGAPTKASPVKTLDNRSLHLAPSTRKSHDEDDR